MIKTQYLKIEISVSKAHQLNDWIAEVNWINKEERYSGCSEKEALNFALRSTAQKLLELAND